MMPSHLLLIFLALASVRQDETIRAYGMGDGPWQVVELNGSPFAAEATMQFTTRNKIAGKAPCNNYSTSMTIPFPWFKVGPIAATKRACPDLALETAFFETLRAVSLAQVTDGRLVLANEDKPLIILTPVD